MKNSQMYFLAMAMVISHTVTGWTAVLMAVLWAVFSLASLWGEK